MARQDIAATTQTRPVAAQAHRLQRTRDWVVMYFYDDHHVEGQDTIITEMRGPLAGKRVVRGREAECGVH